MKRILYWILALTFMSCADDLGNYDYHDLQDLKIEGISSSIQVLAYQNLSIPVTIGGADANTDRYDYEWKAVKQFKPESGEQMIDTLATTKDLNLVITLQPGLYKLIYTVTDRMNGVFYQKAADMSVITTTSKGWLVLCDEQGRVRLDMVADVLGEEVHSKDMLAQSDMPYQRGPRGLIYLNPGLQTDPLSPFYLLTDEGATRLHRDAFAWKPEYDLKYEMGEMYTPKTFHMAAAVSFKAMVDGTDICYCDFSVGGLYVSRLNYIRQADNSRRAFHAAPYVGCNIAPSAMMFAPTYMFYDLDGKQLVGYYGGYYGGMTGDITAGCVPMKDMQTGGTAFEFPVGYDYVYMENTQYDPTYSGMCGTTYTILNDGSKYHLYAVLLGDALSPIMPDYGLPLTTRSYYADLSGCTDIRQASCFAFHSLTNQMFYAVGGKIYRVDLTSGHPSADLQFDLGETITRMKFYLYTEPDNLMRSYELVVASDAGGVEGGKLRVYNASDNMSPLSAKPEELYSGFARIVDMIYREQPSAN